MKPGDRIKLPAAVKKLYEAVEELEKEYDRPFTIDGHLMGSIGEVLARQAFASADVPVVGSSTERISSRAWQSSTALCAWWKKPAPFKR